MPEEKNDDELLDIYLCTARPTPEDKIIDAAIAAVEENPDNTPMREGAGGVGIDARGPAEMAVLTETRWRPGRTLTVAFTDGDPRVQTRVREFAKEWQDHANLKFDFVSGRQGDIRISFERSGSWSYLGTDALVIDKDKPTMNFGWLKPDTSAREYSRVVLHEFGHALSCIHEHSHPAAGIPWDEEKVYRYYKATNGWDRDKTFRNVIRRYDASKTNFSQYDATSIMQYAVPNGLTLGDFEIGWNTVLSDTDKKFISTIYPGAAKQPGDLEPGETVEADIGEHGEEDKYQFTVDSDTPRPYTVETSGRTDVVMSLFGPDDATRLVAFDDDSGEQRNAKISRSLGRGTYHVRVRHYWSTGTGKYSITLRADG